MAVAFPAQRAIGEFIAGVVGESATATAAPALRRFNRRAGIAADDEHVFAKLGRRNLEIQTGAHLMGGEEAATRLGVARDHAIVGLRRGRSRPATALPGAATSGSTTSARGVRVRWDRSEE